MADLSLEPQKPTKTCSRCGQPKAVPDEFPADRRNNDGLCGWCKACASKQACDWQAEHPEKVIAFRRYKYNIDFNALWAQQKGLCAACGTAMLPRGKEPMSVVVDHDRSCCPDQGSCGACVRGLIHNRCNRVIGNAQDDVNLLKSAATYLERWKEGLQ